MPAPARRVLAGAIFADSGIGEHGLDPGADAARRLRFLAPYRPQHIEHERRVDLCHRQVVDGFRLRCERRLPLRGVLCVLPGVTPIVEELLGHFAERLELGCLHGFRSPVLLSFVYWIQAGLDLLACCYGLVSGLGETDSIDGTEPHPPRATMHRRDESVHPRL